MHWNVRFDDAFDPEFDELPAEVQDEMLAHARLLARIWPGAWTSAGGYAGRIAPCQSEGASVQRGAWRVAFAFDPERQAILLVAGDKSGVGEKRFYNTLIKKADERFDAHLERLGKARR